MSKKKNTYKEACDEIVHICRLLPGWDFSEWLIKEEVDITQASSLVSSLKEFRQQLEMDNHVIQDDNETAEIIREGMRIHSLLIKQQMYGED